MMIGNKLEWLKANVELALGDEEFEKFREWLKLKLRSLNEHSFDVS